MRELWSVFCEYFEEKLLCYKVSSFENLGEKLPLSYNNEIRL